MANEILDAVCAAAPLITAEAAATEAAGTLTAPVVDAMRDAGVFRMAMSRALGGPELSPLEQIDVLEALAFADGSAGWCGMINCDGGYATAFLDPTVVKELYPSLDRPTSVIANPTGRARIDGDGYFVSGQWSFASGSPHCELFFLNCLVMDGDDLVPGTGPLPTMRMCAVPAADVEILDTWHTTGLNGTASNDVRVEGVRVSGERTFSLFDADAVDPAPLYSWRWMFVVKLAAVPLGIARAAYEEATEIASTKRTMPTLALAREDATVQDAVGRARASIGSARAYMQDRVGAFWDGLLDGRPPTPQEWADVRLAMTYAAHTSKQAVTLLYEVLGTSGVYRKSPLDRQLRDVTTLAQHLVCQSKTYAAAGRSLLGLEAGIAGF